ncbi:crotonase/enoyl-CoA hydratase family protein [Streptomyces sp. NBC_01808]|uniref:crotonase/enoyl-CoA hydratase family protein n=1 Tax=Streptomyces sp. NBC_01808 TaxID=2975947 RepID=UPI002DD9243C|nr:crotonase/enoyl-CoA hydratase family protein [Streptomyces sp. NBC_01808]WSA36293.1 crotonase/enoyl-CoA hydratase family protein [Streptomyces sp. NBC_01808]
MADPVLVERSGHVVTWTLNLPERRNPVSGAVVVDALVRLADAADADGSVRAVVLTGAGSAFSTGGDIAAMAAGDDGFGGPPHRQLDGYRRGIQRLTRALYGCEVPLIAAVNGPAVGAGCDLALLCDLRLAATDAFFAASFVRLGLVPGDGGAWLLPRAVGAARAAEMLLTGDRVDAATALDWGLVSRVLPPGELLAAAQELAARVAARPPHAVRMAKRLLREAQRQDLDSVLELSAALQAVAHHTDDHRAAVAAFARGER